MEKEEKITILPLRSWDKLNEAKLESITNSLRAKQRFVGGIIQAICFDDEHKLDIVLNDEGKLLGLPINRAWIVDNKVIDIIVGEALICRHDDEGNFCSIHEDDKEIVFKTFMPIIAILNGKVVVINAEGEFEILEIYGEE